MSIFDYEASRTLDAPFHSLIMGAMRGADTGNAERLKAAFPEVWAELEARYNAPAGLLPGETNPFTHYRMDDDGNLYDPDGNLVRAI